MDYERLRDLLPDLTELEKNQIIAAAAGLVCQLPQILAENERCSVSDPWKQTTIGLVAKLVQAIAPRYFSHCSKPNELWVIYQERIGPLACAIATMALTTDFPSEPCTAEIDAGLHFFRGTRVKDEASPGFAIGRMLEYQWRLSEAQFRKYVAAPEPAPEAKAPRGRPPLPEDRKKAAAAAKAEGKSNHEVAKILYATETPTVNQRKGVPTSLRKHNSKLANQSEQ
jgi:hypothetical protein